MPDNGMRHFCTYFDRHYLARGLALHASLTRHCPAFTLWVLCMDRITYDILSRLRRPGLEPIAIEELEAYDRPLAAVKTDRRPVEYYFTCTPALPVFLFETRAGIDLLTYIDADLFFFESPQPIFDEIGAASVAIIEHRFPAHLRDFERYGIYNVGWVSFRRDEAGQECVRWWRERCIEWCYDRYEDSRFADQKYLDDWPRRFRNVVSLQHLGANVAPWNVMQYRVESVKGRVFIDGTPLIFYHFHGFRRRNRWLYDTYLAAYGAVAGRVLRTRVYRRYARALVAATTEVERREGITLVEARPRYLPTPRPAVTPVFARLQPLVDRCAPAFELLTALWRGQCLLAPQWR
jgi:hypothetical protein